MFLLMMECFLGFANRNAAEMSILVPKSNPPANAETKKPRVQSLGLEDPLEKEIATHSKILTLTIFFTFFDFLYLSSFSSELLFLKKYLLFSFSNDLFSLKSSIH